MIIYGYGKDETPEEFCYLLQKSTGEYLGLAGTVIKHSADTEGGSSGSPIINSTTGKVIGIHTNGTCSSLGYNQGTSTFNTSFWTTLETDFFLKAGENPDNIRLNIVIAGTGAVWIDDVRLVKR